MFSVLEYTAGLPLLVAIVLALVACGVLELALHRRTLRRIPIRVHVNGTRGKSSVTRLIAAGLRAAGIRTCAKTTGTLARMILPDGRELPVFRPAGANIIEQKRIVAVAAEYEAQALVIECMALQPELQALSEAKMIRATHAVITNARPDHLDVMGPSDQDVARALAGTIPASGTVFTAEARHLNTLEFAARDRGAKLVALSDERAFELSDDELRRFRYREHRDNVRLALLVCEALGVERQVALQGMWNVRPDPGALTLHQVDFFGRQLCFYNAFAANDPVSTEQLWRLALTEHPEAGSRIAVFNCRSDRPERSIQLASSFASWLPADHVLLMGSGTYLFARTAVDRGLEPSKLVLVENLNVDQIFERIVALVERSAVIVGMGNIGGLGLPLVQYFRNRTAPKELPQ